VTSSGNAKMDLLVAADTAAAAAAVAAAATVHTLT